MSLHAPDVLSDAISRSLYDRYGPEGMKQQAGADRGQGNARQVRPNPALSVSYRWGMHMSEQVVAL